MFGPSAIAMAVNRKQSKGSNVTVKIISLINLQALLQSKVLVLIRTTRGSRSPTWRSRRYPEPSPYPSFFGKAVPQFRSRVALLKQKATWLKLCGFKIFYQISFPTLGLHPIVTGLTGDKMLKQTCASVESSSLTFYTKTGSAVWLVESH